MSAKDLKAQILEDLNTLFYLVPLEDRNRVELAIFQIENLEEVRSET